MLLSGLPTIRTVVVNAAPLLVTCDSDLGSRDECPQAFGSERAANVAALAGNADPKRLPSAM